MQKDIQTKHNNMNDKERYYTKKGKRGFILAISVLIMSVLATIGITSAMMIYRELSITSVAGESNFAFYSADSALECILYRDLHDERRVFWPQSRRGIYSADNISNIKCGNSTVSLNGSVTNSNTAYRTDLKIEYPRENFSNVKDCAFVSVYKRFTGDPNSPSSELYLTSIQVTGKTHCEKSNYYGVARFLSTTYFHKTR